MLTSKKTRRGVIGAVVLAGVLAVGGFALTDQLAAPLLSHAGDGTGTIENEAATNMHYAALSTDPSKVEVIEFDLSHALATTGTAYVQPVVTGNGGGSTAAKWFSCVITGTPTIDGVGYTATASHPVCDISGTATYFSDVDQTRVVAAD